MRVGLAVLLLWFTSVACQGATVEDIRHDCGQWSFGFVKNCVVDLFTGRPVQVIAASVVPGGGVAIGGRYTKLFNKGAWQNEFTAAGASSIRAFWFTDTKVTMTRRPFGANNSARDRFAIQAFVKTRNMPYLPYYGIGPNTSLGNRAYYAMNNQDVGVTVSNPLSSWLAVGGTIDSIGSQVDDPRKDSLIALRQIYTGSQSIGLIYQPVMLHSEVFVRPHIGARPPYVLDYRVGFNWFHDTNTGQYSFSRLTANLQHNLFLERPGGVIRRDSLLNLRAYYSTSFTSANRSVPFYFMETLGGSDINGLPTLRGFKDFRFRGPHLILFQGEYSRRIWGPIGLMGFYDAGTVGVRRSDLELTNLRHSYGGGLAFYLADKVVFRAFVGLGSGEGRHPYFGIPPGLL